MAFGKSVASSNGLDIIVLACASVVVHLSETGSGGRSPVACRTTGLRNGPVENADACLVTSNSDTMTMIETYGTITQHGFPDIARSFQADGVHELFHCIALTSIPKKVVLCQVFVSSFHRKFKTLVYFIE